MIPSTSTAITVPVMRLRALVLAFGPRRAQQFGEIGRRQEALIALAHEGHLAVALPAAQGVHADAERLRSSADTDQILHR